MMEYTKHKCFERANILIQEGTATSLHYAALELRYCMEAITYQKLEASARHIPPSVLEKWQPPQAVKALLEHEPEADKGYVLFAGIEDEYGVPSKDMKPAGEHKAFNLSWLRKHYNKVGKLLHYIHKKTKKSNIPTEEIKSYLEQVSSEVGEVLKGNITGGWLGEVFQFNCQKCSKLIIIGKESLKTGRDIVCQNHNCKAEYFGSVDNQSSKATFELKVSRFNCQSCDSEIIVENKDLNIGLLFQCSNCNTKHAIVNRQWGYKSTTDDKQS